MRYFQPAEPTLFTFTKPCTESWSAMTPTECGRHCSKCDKVVLDFGKLTDEQIVERLNESPEPPCIRTVRKKRSTKVYAERMMRWAITACMILYLQVKKTFAQGTDEKGQTTVPSLKSAPEKKIQQIQGRIVDDESDEPIPFATVVMRNGKNEVLYGSFTDENGYFKIPLKDTSLAGEILLQVRYLGYQDTSYSIPVVQGVIQDLRWANNSTKKLDRKDIVELPLRISRGDVMLGCAVSVKYEPPLIQAIGNNKTYRSEDIQRYNLGR